MAIRHVEKGEPQVTEEQLEELLDETGEVLEELKVLLQDIKVPVTKDSPQVLEAVRNIFGLTYMNEAGTEAYITFDMYLECMSITRNVGRAVAAEFA